MEQRRVGRLGLAHLLLEGNDTVVEVKLAQWRLNVTTVVRER